MKIMHLLFAATIALSTSSAFACGGVNDDPSNSHAKNRQTVARDLGLTSTPVRTPAKPGRGKR